MNRFRIDSPPPPWFTCDSEKWFILFSRDSFSQFIYFPQIIPLFDLSHGFLASWLVILNYFLWIIYFPMICFPHVSLKSWVSGLTHVTDIITWKKHGNRITWQRYLWKLRGSRMTFSLSLSRPWRCWAAETVPAFGPKSARRFETQPKGFMAIYKRRSSRTDAILQGSENTRLSCKMSKSS